MNIATLAQFLVEHNCSISNAASALAFSPPLPPSYLLKRVKRGAGLAFIFNNTSDSRGAIGAGQYDWVLDEGIDPVPWPDTIITEVRTSRKRKIPIFVFVYPGAVYTILYSHGNATDAGQMRSTCVDMCINLRVNVVLYDYTGYGHAQNEDNKVLQPSEADCYADIVSVYDYCLREGSEAWGCNSPDNIILYGESVGSGPSCYLARTRPCRGVVLHAPVLSGARAFLDLHPEVYGADVLASCFAPCDVFPNGQYARHLKTSGVLIMHGARDEVINVDHGIRLYESLPLRLRLQHIRAQSAQSHTSPTSTSLPSSIPPPSSSSSSSSIQISSTSGAAKDGNVLLPNSSSQSGSEGLTSSQHPSTISQTSSSSSSSSSSFLELVDDVTLDPFAPWYPSLAGHSNIRELYRNEYFLRLRAFLVALKVPPTSSSSSSSSSSTSSGSVTSYVPLGPLNRITKEYLSSPIIHPHSLHILLRRGSPLYAQLSNAELSPIGPGSAHFFSSDPPLLDNPAASTVVSPSRGPSPPPLSLDSTSVLPSSAEIDALDISVVTSALHMVASQLGTTISAVVAAYQRTETARGNGDPKPLPRRGSSAFVSLQPALPLPPRPQQPLSPTLPPTPPPILSSSSSSSLSSSSRMAAASTVTIPTSLLTTSIIASRSGSVLASIGKERRYSVAVGGVAEVIRGRTLAMSNRFSRVSELARSSRLAVNDMDRTIGARSWVRSPEPPQLSRARSNSDMPVTQLRQQMEHRLRSRHRKGSKGRSGSVETSSTQPPMVVEDWSVMKKGEDNDSDDSSILSGTGSGRNESTSPTTQMTRSRGNSVSSHREQEIKDGAKKRRERKAKSAIANHLRASPPPLPPLASPLPISSKQNQSYTPVAYLGAVQTQWK